MNSPPPPNRADLEFVRDLVRSCAGRALELQRGGVRGLEVEHKPGGEGPVTRADRELNERIVRALRSRFPGDLVVAEESASPPSPQAHRRCWHVDPIDGTRAFARGAPTWTVQVGLCVGGRPMLGVVAEPAIERLAWALASESGSWHGDSTQGDPAGPLGVSSRTWDRLRMIGGWAGPCSRNRAVLRRLGVPLSRYAQAASVGVRMTSIARGWADLYVQPPSGVRTWDTCGPQALLEAAGGRVTDLRGDPLHYDDPQARHALGMVASHGLDHQRVLETLAPLTRAWL